MGVTPHQLRVILGKERHALRRGWVRLTERQAKQWCCLHVHDNWYDLPLMLMARGYGGDFTAYTEVNADSVYELDESGCYIVFPGWDAFQLWRRK